MWIVFKDGQGYIHRNSGYIPRIVHRISHALPDSEFRLSTPQYYADSVLAMIAIIFFT